MTRYDDGNHGGFYTRFYTGDFVLCRRICRFDYLHKLVILAVIMSYKRAFKEYLTGRVSKKTRDKEYIPHFERLMAHYTDGGENSYTGYVEEPLLAKHPYNMTPQEFLQAYPTIIAKIERDSEEMKRQRIEKGLVGSVGHASCRSSTNHYKKFMKSLL